MFFWLRFSEHDAEVVYYRQCTWLYLCSGVKGLTGGFLRYPMGHSQGTWIGVGDSEVRRNFNPNPHHHLTSYSADCTMYAYVEVYFIIYISFLDVNNATKIFTGLV